jgi:NitT/TauT family transport system substrate-binding protein
MDHTARIARLLACVLLAALCACSSGPGNPQATIRFGWFPWTGWYPVFLAENQGFFAKRGLKVEIVRYESYSDMLSDFAAGKLDACPGGLYELLKLNPPGMRIVLATDYSEGAEGLIAVKEIASPADLLGKRVGVQGAISGSEFILTTYLRRHGLSRESIILVDVGPEAVIDAIPETIQAGYTWEPFLSSAPEKGLRVLFTTADVPGMVPDVVAFQGRMAANAPKAVQAFVDAWFEAADYWLRNPKESTVIIAAGAKAPPEEVTLAGCRLLTLKDNRKAFAPGEDTSSLHHVARLQSQFHVSVGDVSALAQIETILDGSFVAKGP